MTIVRFDLGGPDVADSGWLELPGWEEAGEYRGFEGKRIIMWDVWKLWGGNGWNDDGMFIGDEARGYRSSVRCVVQ